MVTLRGKEGGIPLRQGRDLGRRLATAAVGLPIVVGAIWAGTPWLDTLVGLVALVGTGEAMALFRTGGFRPLRPLGLGAAAGLVAAASLGHPLHPGAVSGLLLACLALPILRRPPRGGWADGAVTAVSALYAGGLLSFALPLRHLPHGPLWLLWAVLTTFAVDTCAYGVGKALGRRPLAPAVSPRKTWEGAGGGLAGGMGAGVALAALLDLPLPWPTALGMGLALGLLAQVGDLAQSLLKRAAGVKEAGHLLPGHGGVLDRLDSVVFVLPLVYYGVRWLERGG